MANKRAPAELQKYVVVQTVKIGDGIKTTYKYFQTQKEAKEWAKTVTGKKLLFRINFDFYMELK